MNKTTRLIRIDCWEPQYGATTLDFCINCAEKEFTVTRNNGDQQLKHVSTHCLLQVRRPLQPRQSYAVREKARNTEGNALKREKEISWLRCVICSGKVTRPYWSWGDCHRESHLPPHAGED